ncbi:MAG TPA: M24 family metallopeptidase [bacterium]|nr:M24 family metallopeptidase [bacterium]HOL50273.1 M24 family metallopeptidase [bacterium]HPO51544.1 M24 family metallopeptidase [bacterium]
MNNEINIKWTRIRDFLSEKNFSGIILNRISNFAWFTGGRKNYVAFNTEYGASSLLVTGKKIFLLSNNIEATRLKQEELVDIPIEDIVISWHQDGTLFENARKIVGGNIAIDKPGEKFEYAAIDHLHFPLTNEEIERFHNLGQKVTQIVREVCHEIKPGMTENEVAGNLSNAFWACGTIPVVLLIAADERIARFRHPVATDKKIEKYVMVVVCVYGNGLIVSMTRLVSFSKLPDEILKKHEAVCRVDATFINSTVPGKTIGEVFKAGIDAYRITGFSEEWEKHHQGGPCGYKTRYYRATAESSDIVKPGYAFAWNPSITGTKSEDTIIVATDKNLIITEDNKWPKIEINTGGTCISRPDILVR